jgi:hypothetical protein
MKPSASGGTAPDRTGCATSPPSDPVGPGLSTAATRDPYPSAQQPLADVRAATSDRRMSLKRACYISPFMIMHHAYRTLYCHEITDIPNDSQIYLP